MSTQEGLLAGNTDPYRDPHLTLEMSRSGPVTVVTVKGEVDGDNAHLLAELVESLGSTQSERLVLDLAQVTFLAAAGVEALLRVRDAVTTKSGQLIVRNPSAIVLTVLAGTRVVRSFQIHTTGQDREHPPRLPLIRRTVG